MTKHDTLFEYKWSEAETVEEVAFLLQRGAEAVILKQNDDPLGEMSSDDANKLAEALSASPNLLALDISSCGLTGNTMKIIVDVLGNCKVLESLILAENTMEAKGSSAVAKFVQDNITLKHLDLSNCGLVGEGLHEIIEALDTNYTMRSFLIDNNQQLSSSSVVALFELIKSRKNIINISSLNTYCDLKTMTDVFSVLKRNQNILFCGFPTFYNNKRGFTSTVSNGSSGSLDDVTRENLVQFSDDKVQKALQSCLKSNFSLVKVYNPHARNDIQLILRRNLELMKHEFNDILLNESVAASEVTEQKIVILGTKGCGKSTLMTSLFGSAYIELSKYFELQIKTKMAMLVKDDGLSYTVKETSKKDVADLSFKCVAKILSRKREKMKKNEKFIKIANAIVPEKKNSTASSRRSARRVRNKLTFFNVPNASPEEEAFKKPAGNVLLQRYKSKGRAQDARFRYNSLDNDSLDNLEIEESPMDGGSVTQTTGKSSFSAMSGTSSSVFSVNEFSPSMRQTEIVDHFDPKVIARFGNHNEKTMVSLKIREISNKIANNMTNGGDNLRKVNSMKSVMSFGSSKNSSTASKKKYSDADKYGDINNSLVDLNNFIYGVKDDDGLYLVCFDMEKLLRYVQTEKNKVILYNPITSFLKQSIKCIYNKSALNNVILVGTNYDPKTMNDESLEIVDSIIDRIFKHKQMKKLVRYKALRFFPVDSLNKTNVELLKATILKKLTKTTKNTVSKMEQIPVKYIRAMDVLRIYKLEQKKNFISREKFFEIVSEFGFAQIEDIDPLLKFLQARNELIMFENIDLLKDFIVLNKSFLYFCIYQLINRKYVTKILTDKSVRAHLKENDLGKDLIVFTSKRLLSRDLIEFIWRSNNHFLMKTSDSSAEMYFDENRAAYLYILEVMKKVLFLTEWKNPLFNIPTSALSAANPITAETVANLHVENYFIIPSLMKNSTAKGFITNPKSKIRNLKSLAIVPSVPVMSIPKRPTTQSVSSVASRRQNPKTNPVIREKQVSARRSVKRVKAKISEISHFSEIEPEQAEKSSPRKRVSVDAGSFVQSSRAKRDFGEVRTRGRSKENLTLLREKQGKTSPAPQTINESALNPSKSTRKTESSAESDKKKTTTTRGRSKNVSARRSVKRGENVQPKKEEVQEKHKSKERKSKTNSKSARHSAKRKVKMTLTPDPVTPEQKEKDMYAQLELMNGKFNMERKQSITRTMRKMIKMKREGSREPAQSQTSSLTDPSRTLQMTQRKRYLLDKNKPVSLLLDFNEGFLPDGLFLRLSNLLYTACVEEMKLEASEKTSGSFAKAIESVELYKNCFKLTFDRMVRIVEDEEVDESTSGSLCGSEFESISVIADPRKLDKDDPKEEEKEYVMLYSSANQDSLVLVVRDHENAPRFLNMLMVSLDILDADSEFGMMFYKLDMNIKVEVKNNKFIPFESARNKGFAPWFGKNVLVSPPKKMSMRSVTSEKSLTSTRKPVSAGRIKSGGLAQKNMSKKKGGEELFDLLD